MASQRQVLHIAGWNTCAFYKKAAGAVSSLGMLFPQRLQVVEHSFNSRTEYRAWLIDGGFRTGVPDSRAHSHTSSPFTWFANNDALEVNNVLSFVGGCDDTLDWCRGFCAPDGGASKPMAHMAPDGHTADHTYDYDLVVIGGGSGGLAASKEAASFGARVAVLDFVKPSPAGTKWGLGGTCVNVGCIPKKLMHTAALLNEGIKLDSKPFGITTSSPPEAQTHSWEDMRASIQNHIKGLNFKYRVALREAEVSYLNKLGKFKDKHTLEVTDKKGNTTEITASRFLVAVGGRPSALDCEGGELAITSDDIFALEEDPGKVLCVGASYISLECAGFLAGLGHDTTVAVRSILLRGFDREYADLIGKYMEEESHVNFKYKVTPVKLERQLRGGKIKVTFSDGTEDEYDTVMTAIGRQADTDTLGLDNVGVKTNPKNKKIICAYEQTDCPNIYAIGDVMEGCPELTPVAIQAGLSLARRLFNGATEPMDYLNIATTVFTPIEYATVGYSEEDAIKHFSECAIEIYHKEFTPLEWSLTEKRSIQGRTKVIVNKEDNQKVVGIHYVGPHAGEVMQGYGAAIKKGLTFQDLMDTVGIHPTSAEEIVTLSITKSSGKSASAGGC